MTLNDVMRLLDAIAAMALFAVAVFCMVRDDYRRASFYMAWAIWSVLMWKL